ncbi:iron chaperone [Streptomyces sp. NPDC001927]
MTSKASTTTSNTTNTAYEGFTAEERAAMKDHAQELRAAARRGSRADKAAEAERDVLAKIAEMQDSDRTMAERLHAVITAAAPALAPKLWYGMPAYALDGKVLCFFQSAEKFKARYATLGFSDLARLDAGPMWPAGFALTEVTPEVEARVGELVKQAVR